MFLLKFLALLAFVIFAYYWILSHFSWKMSVQAQNNVNLARVGHWNTPTRRESLCAENEPCFSQMPSIHSTPLCSTATPNVTCRCSSRQDAKNINDIPACDVESGDGATYQYGYCDTVETYQSRNKTVLGVQRSHTFCRSGVTIVRGFPTRNEDEYPAVAPNVGALLCWMLWRTKGYAWKDSACTASRRYVGETCWRHTGTCDNSAVGWGDARRLTCAVVHSKAEEDVVSRCVPTLRGFALRPCSCDGSDSKDAPISELCGAKECHGHACKGQINVDAQRYCDFEFSDNDW